MSSMKLMGTGRLSANQRGNLNVLLIPFILLVLLFGGAVAFGFWAFSGRQNYKNNSDQIVATAVAAAKQQTQNLDAKNYAEAAKNPLKTYVGPSSFGSISVQYPKTWSSYVVENATSSTPVNGYFQPNFVPDINSDTNAFWLRLQLTQDTYTSVMNNFAALVQSGQATVAPYSLPKVPSVVGSMVKGQINGDKQGTMIVVPLRNYALKIWTESSSASADFTNNILPNLSFSP